ncbi:hypothetical protein FA048_12055 [Pedobacter polaris]|uniref:Uncharacterized protein n=1 Tax=Pedobacter polaris TaxID=2571273 RepID=A0A4U1CUQ7_9SPHI|nr:hypothetical protein [Pedobacter polaris]TKC10895.1 hypothetical protein FA048_12055 [Pedobacter polaris]
MDEFKPTFNFIIPVFRFLVVILIGWFTLFFHFIILVQLFNKGFDLKTICSIIFIELITFFFGFMFIKAFLIQTKNFVFSKKGIEQINFLNFSKKYIKKEDVIGYSASDVRYRIKTFKQIIIYLRNGKKIEITQFCFIDFKLIEVALMHNGYHYFGFEPHRWKWFDGRHYQFEKSIS